MIRPYCNYADEKEGSFNQFRHYQNFKNHNTYVCSFNVSCDFEMRAQQFKNFVDERVCLGLIVFWELSLHTVLNLK